MPIPPVARDKIAHGNAERLLELTNELLPQSLAK